MKHFLLVALGALLLAGCASDEEMIENQTETEAIEQQQTEPETGINETTMAEPIAGSDAQTSAIEDEQLAAQEMLADTASPIATRIIYFEYDSAKVTQDSLGVLEAHGNFVAGNGSVHVRLEGHADERGSREYNIGLGDRRAQSVRRILLFQGASSDQVETVSYGEEKPAEQGHNEDAWARNRRVELVYQVR